MMISSKSFFSDHQQNNLIDHWNVYSWTLVIFTEQGFGVGKFFMAMVFPFSWFEKLILYRIPTFCLFPFGSKSSHLYLDFCFLIIKTISELCCQDDRAPRGILRCPRYDRVSPMERVVGHFKILTQTEYRIYRI